jgi:hypothetical protein
MLSLLSSINVLAVRVPDSGTTSILLLGALGVIAAAARFFKK